MASRRRVSSEGVVLAYGARYSWAYVVVIALIVIAVVLRPGGLRGPRHAGQAERESAERSFPGDE
jgi:hypothetical protein